MLNSYTFLFLSSLLNLTTLINRPAKSGKVYIGSIILMLSKLTRQSVNGKNNWVP